MRRVVVTGQGIVTSLGVGVGSVWKKILSGASGLSSLPGPQYDKIPCRVAGVIPLDIVNLDQRFTESERKTCSRATLFGLLAAEEAIGQAGLLGSPYPKERVGVMVGMGMLDLQDIIDTGHILTNKGYSRLSPYFIPRILPNLAAGQISIKYGFQGPNHCASTACASGLHGIGDAFNLIRLNYADAVVAGGTEACISPLAIATFCRLRALSTKYNDTPTEASRPFDKDRDGFVMGEGAGVLVLEEYECAKARGAKIYAEILGYGLSGDGSHMTAAREDGHGAYLAMKQSLDMAQVTPNELSYVNCHATSTPIGDKAEIRAISKLFADSGSDKSVALSSTKGHIGHLLGAAGSVELILTVQACHSGIPPPCLNIKSLEEDFNGLNIVKGGDSVQLNTGERIIALKNSFGFGGTNASICISNFKP